MPVTDDGTATKEVEEDATPSASPDTEAVETGGPAASSGSVKTTLASAGHTLEGPESELVLNPLRLAFETKSPKVIELALDCLHVRHFCFILALNIKYITYVGRIIAWYSNKLFFL